MCWPFGCLFWKNVHLVILSIFNQIIWGCYYCVVYILYIFCILRLNFFKLQIELPCDSAVPLVGTYPKEMKHSSAYCSPTHNSQGMETVQLDINLLTGK